MGLTHVTVKVGNPANGRPAEEVRCLVDSGAMYSSIPGSVLQPNAWAQQLTSREQIS